MSSKLKKTIGLIALTVAVVVIIFLIVWYVQKSENDKKQAERLETAHIGQLCECDGFDMKILTLDNSLTELGDLKASEDNCFLLIKTEIAAHKDITIKASDFEVKDGEYKTVAASDYEMLGEQLTVKAGETKTFYLAYEVKSGRIESYYLQAYGYKVDLGGTLQGPVLSSGDIS